MEPTCGEAVGLAQKLAPSGGIRLTGKIHRRDRRDEIEKFTHCNLSIARKAGRILKGIFQTTKYAKYTKQNRLFPFSCIPVFRG